VSPSVLAHPDCRGARSWPRAEITATRRILNTPDFEAAELILTTNQHTSFVMRAFVVGGRLYVLSRQTYPGPSDDTEHSQPPSEDQEKFFDSFLLAPSTQQG
jgi:hypothetical protein